LFRIFHYPPHEEARFGDDTWAVGKHSDYGFLTLLLQVGGHTTTTQISRMGGHKVIYCVVSVHVCV
jgi:isopenicillin N synthase-like dioxygenase